MLFEEVIGGEASTGEGRLRIVESGVSQGREIDEGVLFVKNEDVTQSTESTHGKRRKVRDDSGSRGQVRSLDISHHPMQKFALRKGEGGEKY